MKQSFEPSASKLIHQHRNHLIDFRRVTLLSAFFIALSISPAGFAQQKTKPQSATGQRLFKQFDCSSCHSIKDVGGCIAPPLDGVTSRRSEQYLKLRLRDDKEDAFIALIKHPEIFPHPRFKPKQVYSLIAYLRTLAKHPTENLTRSHNISAKIAKEPPSSIKFQPGVQTPSTREGRRLFLETGCMACHSIGNTGGSIGPALDGIGARHTRQFIDAQITNPQAHARVTDKQSSGSRMVQTDLFPDQVKSIADYLLTLPPR